MKDNKWCLGAPCEEAARNERKSPIPGETPDQYWRAVRSSMPPFFWNRVAKVQCEWCDGHIRKFQP